MRIPHLTYEQYQNCTLAPMTNVTAAATPTIDIWPMVAYLVDQKLVPKIALEKKLVEAVYLDKLKISQHILLPTDQANEFLCIIVNLLLKKAMGYYIVPLVAEYGTEQQIKAAAPSAPPKNIHEDQTQTLAELRQITSTRAYKKNGTLQVKEIHLNADEKPTARFVFEITIDDFSTPLEDLVPEVWEVTCPDADRTEGIPLYFYPGSQIKLFDEHPILWQFDDQIGFSLAGKPDNIAAFIGELLMEHSDACGDWVDFQWLYGQFLYAFESNENQLSIPANLKDAYFPVLDRHGIQYKINKIEQGEKGYRVLFFSYESSWPDNENYKQCYIIGKEFSERKLS